MGLGSSEMVLGAMDVEGAWNTPDGMEYESWKGLIEEMSAELGAGETTQKALKLLSDILTGGKNIPKHALNDEWIKMAKEGTTLSKDFIEYLEAHVKENKDENEEEK